MEEKYGAGNYNDSGIGKDKESPGIKDAKGVLMVYLAVVALQLPIKEKRMNGVSHGYPSLVISYCHHFWKTTI